ncbi:MAG: hypothetical protein ABJ308_07205 [Halieaceae bacterium]
MTDMANYTYLKYQGHLVVNLSGRQYLLDTGSPFSVGTEPISIAGMEFLVQDSYLDLTPASLVENIGLPLEGLIGADIIKAFTVSVFPAERVIQFNHLPAAGELLVPIKQFTSVPILPIGVQGKVLQVFLDTGSPLSYLPLELLAGLEPRGLRDVYYPLLGNFTTQEYLVDTNIGGERCPLHFGALPQALEALTVAGSVQGILGTEILKHFGLSLSLQQGVLMLEKRAGLRLVQNEEASS